MGGISGNYLGPLLQCSLNDSCLCIGLTQIVVMDSKVLECEFKYSDFQHAAMGRKNTMGYQNKLILVGKLQRKLTVIYLIPKSNYS